MAGGKNLAALVILAILVISGAFLAGNHFTSMPTTGVDTSVTSFNDGFADGMQNAHDLGPTGTAAWLAASSR